ncbi:hypothetical protein V6N12_075087 [Hibiscus sabdariffa]|uniref:Uncharacterized protein n=1 Tax=Hibiscus sabdariffa TaxID=183260 RepID=A0ABR2BZI7_9ROSI
MFDVGMLCLSSLPMAYGNIMLIFLATSNDCVLAVKIPFSDVGSRCSLRFRRFCSYAGEITAVSPGSKILWWFHPFHCLFLMTRSLYSTYRETLLRPWSSLINFSMTKDWLRWPQNQTFLSCFFDFRFSSLATLLLWSLVMLYFCFSRGLSMLFCGWFKVPFWFVFWNPIVHLVCIWFFIS